jgi:hypothetical protein
MNWRQHDKILKYEDKIESWCCEHGFRTDIEVKRDDTKKYIHYLLNYDCLYVGELNDDIWYLYVALYFSVNNNYPKMEEYYLKAIELKNVIAQIELVNYYNENKRYTEMKEIVRMNINGNNSECMFKLGCYYKNVKNNYTKTLNCWFSSTNSHYEIAFEMESIFDKLTDKQLEICIPYKHLLYKKHKDIIDEKLQNGDISEPLIKCAHKLSYNY